MIADHAGALAQAAALGRASSEGETDVCRLQLPEFFDRPPNDVGFPVAVYGSTRHGPQRLAHHPQVRMTGTKLRDACKIFHISN